MVLAMCPINLQAEVRLDAAMICRLAQLAGLELAPARAALLLVDLVALIEADRQLAALDLRDSTATGAPWGRSSTDA
jgi:hypothetical protein